MFVKPEDRPNDGTCMSGYQLFTMYVQAGLCATEYRWEKLSIAMQERWNSLASQLECKHNK